jgi:hypothetical protein
MAGIQRVLRLLVEDALTGPGNNHPAPRPHPGRHRWRPGSRQPGTEERPSARIAHCVGGVTCRKLDRPQISHDGK